MMLRAVTQSFIGYYSPFTIKIVKTSTSVTRGLKYIAKNNKNMLKKYEYASLGYGITNNESRKYSAQNKIEDEIVNYDYVKSSIEKQDILIVDVREPDEIKEHGKIPNSVNIPVGNINDVFNQMSEKDFQSAYKKMKPCKDTEIIFYCMIGKRSDKAQQTARNLGFKNAKNYLGSWNDWASKTKK